MWFQTKKKKMSALYPLSFETVEKNHTLVREIFMTLEPHKGVYIGVSPLEGTYVCENPALLAAEMKIGEKLILCEDDVLKDESGPLLAVKRNSGETLGYLSFTHAVLPKMLLKRKLSLWCHLEIFELSASVPKIAVSIYCENY